MSTLLADIDATCASLGYNDGSAYHPEADALQGLKHLNWILRRDGDTHEYRRYLGRGKVLQTDLLPMLMHHTVEDDLSDVLLRLLVNLTNPALLLYREELPKDGPGRRNFLELIEILQGYKAAFALQPVWASLGKRLQTVMEKDWAERSEEQGLLIERILVLVRNVLTVPASPDTERRADNDASLHDQVLWALHQAGVLDLVLYIIGSEFENQYHLHALEIVCLVYREQTAESLADASLKRSAAEKQRDEQELIAVRRREKAKFNARPPAGRHSRFGGTYVMTNLKSVSDNDIICHQSLTRAVKMDFDREKGAQKRLRGMVAEEASTERRSAFSVRLFLREFCVEILESAFNNLIRHVRRTLERSGTGHDDSYLLWALRFCLEFNRLSGFKLHLVSEALSTQCFHWVLSRIQHHIDMMGNDKKNARLWARRLHIGVQAYKELLLSLIALQKVAGEDAQAMYKMLLNNVCYVMEFRESMLHTVMNYDERHSTKAYLRDVVEVCHIFCKIMEHFGKGGVVVQQKHRVGRKRGGKKTSKSAKAKAPKQLTDDELQSQWALAASQISAVLTGDITLPESQHPLPYDAVSEQSMDDQKDSCTVRLHTLLHQQKFEHAVILLRSAREVWPEDDCFGSATAAPEDEMMLLHEIYLTNLGPVPATVIDGNDDDQNDVDDEDDDEDDDDEEGSTDVKEADFRFEDFEKRLVNARVVRACTIVLADWEKLTARVLKSAVTLLHRISVNCKMPTMLYQASLFHVFQGVLRAPFDKKVDEFRRLAVYVVRHFVKTAPGNPKVYAELLFYKNVRECNDLENNYDGQSDGPKKNWTEEQEDELRQLYMENQTNPTTDKDVIDWIHDNLIDHTRTRRAIIIKLKELGLIFKAPTKKHNALAKNAWLPEHEQQLRDLYDEHRMDIDCLKNIMESIDPKRSKPFIINKMINTGLIADKSEILPSKRRKAKHLENNGDSSEDDVQRGEEHEEYGSDDEGDQRPATVRQKKPSKPKQRAQRAIKAKTNKRLDVTKLRSQISTLEETYKSVLEWLEESLNDAAEDMVSEEEKTDDPDDCVPLVPFTADQREAMDDPAFQALLTGLGMHQPTTGMETYWRIPSDLSAQDIKLRAQVVAGTAVEQEVDEVEDERPPVSDAESEDYDFNAARLNRANNLVYNQSDDEESENRSSLRKSKKAKADTSKGKSKKKFDIFDMVNDTNDADDSGEQDDKSKKAKADKPKGKSKKKFDMVDMAKETTYADESGEQNDDTTANRIGDSDSEDDMNVSHTKNTQTKRAKRVVIESDDEEDDASKSTEVPNEDLNESFDNMGSLRMEEDSPPRVDSRNKRDRSIELDDSPAADKNDSDDDVGHRVKRKRAAVISDDDD